MALRAGVAQRRGVKPLGWGHLTALLTPPEARNPSGCRRANHFRHRAGSPPTIHGDVDHLSSFKSGRVRAGPGDARLADIGDIAGEPDQHDVRVSGSEPQCGRRIDDVDCFDRTGNEFAQRLDGDAKRRGQRGRCVSIWVGHVATSRDPVRGAQSARFDGLWGSCHTRCVAWAGVGTMIAANCPCGYENDELAIGGGMLTFMEHCAAPALCTSCREVVTIDLMDRNAACPNCGGAPTPYDDPSLRAAQIAYDGSAIAWNLPDGRSFALDHQGAYTCPRCLQTTMSFIDVGCFD